MKRNAFLWTIFAAIAIGVSGCSDAQEPDPSAAKITIQNRTSVLIEIVWLARCDAENLGEDRLGATEVINQGADRRFVVDPGCWDMVIQTGDHRNAEKRGVQLAPKQDFVWTVDNF